MLKTHDVSVIVLDIDHFKRINDEFGHPAGDAVIVELVRRVQAGLGDGAEVGRVGGEEFTIVLPDADLAQAAATAEILRASLADRHFAAVAGRPVTASFGVSWNARGTSFDAAYARADQMLYEAKRNGRDRVVWKLTPAD
jgi:diguanylate cyclase (GGDEF)-like protein